MFDFPTSPSGIDPMAFVPGALLDPSQYDYAASLAVQACVEQSQPYVGLDDEE